MAIIFVDGIEIACEKTGSVSDGFHTFDDLYDHRCLLYINLCLAKPASAAWKYDGPSWFLLYLELDTGQISYHLPVRMLPLVLGFIRRDDSYQWDKHKSPDVAARLFESAKRRVSGKIDPAEHNHEHDDLCENCGARLIGSHGCHD